MSKITKQRLLQIVAALDETTFTAAAFSIDQPDGLLVSVTYRDDPKHYASLFHGKKTPKNVAETIALGLDRESVLCYEVNPGGLLESERREEIDFEDFRRELGRWAKRIENELSASSLFFEKLGSFEEELNRKLNDSFTDPNERFSREEREEVAAKLREIEKRFAELQKQQQVTSEQVAALSAVITELTSASTTLPKKAWFRSALSRLFSFGEKMLTSEAGQKALGIVIDRFLQAPKS